MKPLDLFENAHFPPCPTRQSPSVYATTPVSRLGPTAGLKSTEVPGQITTNTDNFSVVPRRFCAAGPEIRAARRPILSFGKELGWQNQQKADCRCCAPRWPEGLRLIPSHRTMERIARVAVADYEAAAAEHKRRPPSHAEPHCYPPPAYRGPRTMAIACLSSKCRRLRAVPNWPNQPIDRDRQ